MTNEPTCSTPGCANPARFNTASSLAYPSNYVCGEHLWSKPPALGARARRRAQQAAEDEQHRLEQLGEMQAENAWLRYAEREDPEAQADLARHDFYDRNAYANDLFDVAREEMRREFS